VNVLLPPEDVRGLIGQGQKLLLAGDEELLSDLPAGCWIGGTTPYFMIEQHPQHSREKIHVTVLPDFVQSVDIRQYDETSIHRVYADAPANGISFIIIPAKASTHYTFALHAPNFESFAVRPLIGWISGVDLKKPGFRLPKAYNGMNKAASENEAVVMHITLPGDKVADIGIINLFSQGSGDQIVFPDDGFKTRSAYINGRLQNYRDYLLDKNIDTWLPLVADYHGISINTSIREVNERQEAVEFYAPVFSNLSYKHARPVTNYNNRFEQLMPTGLEQHLLFACNCILNHRDHEPYLEAPPGIPGPITFGEIAYLLLNQTMVYVRIIDLPSPA